jgi:hypothetical protein
MANDEKVATAHCSLLIAHCSLLIAHCSLLTAHCSLLALSKYQDQRVNKIKDSSKEHDKRGHAFFYYYHTYDSKR